MRITQRTWAKLQALLALSKSKMSNYEFHGFGKVEVDEEGNCLLVDVDMPKQEASSAHIVTNPSDLLDWRRERFALRPGMTDEEIAETNEEMQSWRCWWHSHGSMNPTYSDTDFGTLRDLAEEAKGLFFGLVVKDNMDNKAYAALHRPVDHPLFDIPEVRTPVVELGYAGYDWPEFPDLDAECEAAFANVRKKESTTKPAETKEKGKKGKVTEISSWPVLDDGESDYYFEDPKKLEFTQRKCTCDGPTAWGRARTKMPKGGISICAKVLCVDCESPPEECFCAEPFGSVPTDAELARIGVTRQDWNEWVEAQEKQLGGVGW